MIVVLKYSIKDNLDYTKILDKLDVNYSFTLNESIITNASHIIFPDTYNLNTAIKKMQLMNLFSMLRMIKKPMLGINNGFNLMCNNIVDIQKNGLGLFSIDTKSCNQIEDSKTKNGQLNILQKTSFLNGIAKRKITCNLDCSVDRNEFTTSVIKSKKKEYSLTCEFKNYYSIQMDLSCNEKLFEKLIGNFVKL
ncbi:MAG: hypothetical protein V3V16_13335 [Melioribacteraceae bacterium]